MTVTKDELVEAISKLNDMTRRGLLRWRLSTPVRLAESIGTAYETDYSDRRLRLIEYIPPRVRGFYQGASLEERAYGAAPARELVLEIVDDQAVPIYEFPKVQGIVDLFASVRAQSADVEGLIRSLLTAQ